MKKIEITVSITEYHTIKGEVPDDVYELFDEMRDHRKKMPEKIVQSTAANMMKFIGTHINKNTGYVDKIGVEKIKRLDKTEN
jgi:hypothetical protein